MKFKWKGKEWYIDGLLANALNTIAYNIKDDWDFVIFIAGDRMTRVGKSVLAQVVCGYLAYCLERMKLNDDAFNIDRIYFEGKKMMEDAFKLPKYSVLCFDEGRESLAKSKMKGFTQDLLDFFTECGQLNHCFVVVAPDWFELKEEVTVAKSEVMINVYRKPMDVKRDIFKDGNKVPITKFSRGYFEFFSRKKKSLLYDKFRTTRRKSYGMVRANFTGRFTHQYLVDEEAYRAKKKESLARFEKRKEEEKKNRTSHKEKTYAEVLREVLPLLDPKDKKWVSEKLEHQKDYVYRIEKKLQEATMAQSDKESSEKMEEFNSGLDKLKAKS